MGPVDAAGGVWASAPTDDPCRFRLDLGVLHSNHRRASTMMYLRKDHYRHVTACVVVLNASKFFESRALNLSEILDYVKHSNLSI